MADPIIIELVDESKLLATYYRRKGNQTGTAILGLISEIEQAGLDKVNLATPSVIKLNELFTAIFSKLPSTALRNLKASGGGYVTYGFKRSLWLAILVCLSIVSMFVVGRLTHIYNRGVSLSAELAELEAQKPFRTFALLERNLLYAQSQLELGHERNVEAPTLQTQPDSSAVESGVAQNEANRYRLAQETSQQYVADLVELDQRIDSLADASTVYQKDAIFPFPGMETLQRWYQRASSILACHLTSGYADSTAADSTFDESGKSTEKSPANCSYEPPATAGFGYYPRLTGGMRDRLCPSIEHADLAELLSPLELQSLERRFGLDVKRIVKTSCQLGLRYFSDTVPFIQTLKKPIADIISVYSFLILPCLFGAFGALMYFMRQVLDPKAIDPPLHRTLHRVALGALSGMILAWLWNGMFSADGDLKAVGLGVFALAFVFGFSIDVFFALLDRLVRLSTSAVNRIGDA